MNQNQDNPQLHYEPEPGRPSAALWTRTSMTLSCTMNENQYDPQLHYEPEQVQPSAALWTRTSTTLSCTMNQNQYNPQLHYEPAQVWPSAALWARTSMTLSCTMNQNQYDPQLHYEPNPERPSAALWTRTSMTLSCTMNQNQYDPQLHYEPEPVRPSAALWTRTSTTLSCRVQGEHTLLLAVGRESGWTDRWWRTWELYLIYIQYTAASKLSVCHFHPKHHCTKTLAWTPTSQISTPPSTPPPPPPITLPHCWGWGLTDVKCNGHSNGWPQGVAATHPLEKKQKTLFVRKLQAANQRKSLHLHNSRFARDHTVLFVVRSLLKASPQLHAHTMVDLLQTTPYSLPSDYTSDHFLWSQISAKIPSYHTFTQQQNHCRPPCCILCCQTTDQTSFSQISAESPS